MEQDTEIPEELCTDEAIGFIATRHHVTPRQLLHAFLSGEAAAGGAASAKAAIALEPNEAEILKGLLHMAESGGYRY